MKKAYITLVKKALSLGFTVSVFDGEIWDVKRSTKYKEIIDSIESVEQAELRFRDGDEIVGWARVLCDLDPEETVADHTVADWIETALA